MEERRLIYGFSHYRTDLGDGIRTGIYFGRCGGMCTNVCMARQELKEHDFGGDSKEQKLYTVSELLEYLREEKILFPAKPLGISFLGMEPLHDYRFCEALGYGISKMGMSLQITTCGLCNPLNYLSLRAFCELFYFRMFAPLPSLYRPFPEFSFDHVWGNLIYLEKRKIPYRLLIPVIKDVNSSVNVADAFGGIASMLKSMKSVVLDFNKSGFTEEQKAEYRHEFLKHDVILY